MRELGNEAKVLVVHFIGSPAPIDVIATSPRAEAAIAIAGPLTSLILGVGLAGIAFSWNDAGATEPVVATIFAVVAPEDTGEPVIEFTLEGS